MKLFKHNSILLIISSISLLSFSLTFGLFNKAKGGNLYDGLVVIKIEGLTIEKRKIAANNPTELDNIDWNTEVYVYVGLDCVWKTKFLKQKINASLNEGEILKRLQSYKGPMVSVSHTFGMMAVKLKNYPNIYRWIYRCMRSGYMSERAFREIQFLAVHNTIN